MATLLSPSPARLPTIGPIRLAWGFATVFSVVAMAIGIGGRGDEPVNNLVVSIGFGLAAGFGVARWRRTRARNDALLASAYALPAVGMLAYVVGYGDPDSYAYSGVDLFFLAAYPLAAAALLTFPKPPSKPGTQLLMWLNGAIGGVAIASLLLVIVGFELFDHLANVTSQQKVFILIYATVNVGTMALTAAVLIRRSMIRMDPRTAALMIGLTAIATNDLHYTLGVARGAPDPAYAPILIGAGAFIFVALYPDRADTQEDVISRRLPIWLLLLPFALVGSVSVALLGAHSVGDHDRSHAAAVALIIVSLLVMSQQLHLLLLERREVGRIRGDLVATVSHEFRTPLSAVVASLELLASHALSQEETTELIELGREQADRMRCMIEDLVDLSRGTLATRRLVESTVPLTDVVSEAMRRSGAVDTDVAVPADIMVTADSERLAQAIAEFLENAVRFGHGAAMVIATERGGTVRIEVHDDGPGVPDRYHQVIWDAFERGGRRLDSRIQGAGLGLAVAAAIATSHGGHHRYATSELMGGAAFIIELPGRGFRRI
jgi:signal transduction histidine kinase